MKRPRRQKRGFSLTELLMVLLILGEIATFTIPKVLQAQSNNRKNAMAREAVGMLSGAYQRFKLSNTVATTFSGEEMFQYINYVRKDTVSQVEGDGFTWECSYGNVDCRRLHNGGLIAVITDYEFGALASDRAIPFQFDADGKHEPGVLESKPLEIWLHYDGRITTKCCLNPAGVKFWSNINIQTYTRYPDTDPPWFKW